MLRLDAADDIRHCQTGEAIREMYFALLFDCKAVRRPGGGGRQKLTYLPRGEK